MPIFLTIQNFAGKKSSFLAESLTADSNFPGNLLAAGISSFPLELAQGQTLNVSAWSFKATDLDSYMVGQIDNGFMDLLAAVPEAQAKVEPGAEEGGQTNSEPEHSQEQTSTPANTPTTKRRRK